MKIAIARSAAACLLALATAGFYWLMWDGTTPDMNNFLIPWLDHIVATGPVGAFASPFSNYTPPYLYLLTLVSPLIVLFPKITVIKLLSVAGTGALALAIGALLNALSAPRPALGAALTFLVPSVALNAAFLGQCDALWVAPCVMVVASALREQRVAMLLWAGIAIAIKAQASFIAPFIFAVLIANKTPFRYWLIPPAVFVAAMLPAWAAGWPAGDLAAIYLRQANYSLTISDLANPWILVDQFAPAAADALFAPGLAIAALATAAYIIVLHRRGLDKDRLLAAALLSAFMLPWLLPRMHERYFLLADLLAYALAWARPSRDTVIVSIAVQACSLASLFSYTFHRFDPVIAGCALSTVALAAMIRLVNRGVKRRLPAHAEIPTITAAA